MSEPTALAASPPQPGSRGESPGWRVRHEPGGVGEDASEGHRMEVSGLRGKEGVVVFAQGERGGAKPNPSLAPLSSPPPPGLFPRKLYQCGHARRRHLGRLVSRCRGEEAGFSCVAAGRGRTDGSPAPPQPAAAQTSSLLLPMAPVAPPRRGGFLLQGHILSRRRSRPLPPNTHPFLSFLFAHTGGVGWGGVVLAPLIGLLKQPKVIQELKRPGLNLYLWISEVAIF